MKFSSILFFAALALTGANAQEAPQTLSEAAKDTTALAPISPTDPAKPQATPTPEATPVSAPKAQKYTSEKSLADIKADRKKNPEIQEYSIEARKKEKPETKKSPAEKRAMLDATPKNIEALTRMRNRLYDSNGDGKLDRYELQDFQRDMLLKNDLNGDGKLDEFEYQAMAKSQLKDQPIQKTDSKTESPQSTPAAAK